MYLELELLIFSSLNGLIINFLHSPVWQWWRIILLCWGCIYAIYLLGYKESLPVCLWISEVLVIDCFSFLFFHFKHTRYWNFHYSWSLFEVLIIHSYDISISMHHMVYLNFVSVYRKLVSVKWRYHYHGLNF